MQAPVLHRWWPIVPAVLLGAWLGAPSVARASCGDYVVIGGQPARGQHSGMTPPTVPLDHRPLPVPAPDHRGPCHGPSCSGAPAMPVPPAPAPTGPHGEEWGWLSTTPGGPENGPTSWRRGCDAPRPSTLSTSIFHPPRRDASPSA